MLEETNLEKLSKMLTVIDISIASCDAPDAS